MVVCGKMLNVKDGCKVNVSGATLPAGLGNG